MTPKTPNWDERMEAMRQQLELVSHMQQDTDKQIRRLGKYIRTIAGMVLDHETRLRTIEGDDEQNGDEQ